MPSSIGDILHRIGELEDELERGIAEKGREWHYRFEANRVRFEREIQAYHRSLRKSIPRFVRDASLRNALTAPVIYSVVMPLAILDVWFSLYQSVCFPIYGIPKVRRSDYFVLDRHQLAYLNGIEKLNCLYCGYANGLLAYVREIAGRTEQYWCPIKHARRVRTPHSRYRHFVDYGDAEGYRTELPRLRQTYDDVDTGREATGGGADRAANDATPGS